MSSISTIHASRAVSAAPAIPAYFVVMRDLGRLGREAVVDPEITRAGVIDRLVKRDYDNVLFIHHVADGVASDVTLELQLEASAIVEAA